MVPDREQDSALERRLAGLLEPRVPERVPARHEVPIFSPPTDVVVGRPWSRGTRGLWGGRQIAMINCRHVTHWAPASAVQCPAGSRSAMHGQSVSRSVGGRDRDRTLGRETRRSPPGTPPLLRAPSLLLSPLAVAVRLWRCTRTRLERGGRVVVVVVIVVMVVWRRRRRVGLTRRR